MPGIRWRRTSHAQRIAEGATGNQISGGTVNGPVVQGRDVTVHMRTPAPPVMSRTLIRDTPTFTGRDGELRTLVDAVTRMEAGRSVLVCTINGMPGVGKTALAVHAAHRLTDRFPDGQLFITLDAHADGPSHADPTSVLEDLLLGLGVEPRMIPAGLQARAALWRDRLAGRRVLVVLDNVASESQIEPLLPATAGSLALVTSRAQLAVPGAIPIKVDRLSPAEGASLFVREAARPVSHDDQEAVHELVDSCGGLPLAIAIMAARYTHHTTWTLAHLVVQMREHEPMRHLRHGDRSVQVAFEVSYRDLPPRRQRVLRMLGLYPGGDFDAYAIAALAELPLPAARAELDSLTTASLLIETGPGRYHLHDLLRAYTRDLAATACDTTGRSARTAAERLLGYYTHTAHAAGRHYRRFAAPDRLPAHSTPAAVPPMTCRERAGVWLETEHGNLLAAIRAWADVHHPHAVALSTAIAGFLLTRGHWDQAAALHSKVLAAADRWADQHGRATALTNLGHVHQRRGEYDQAADHYRQALALYTELDDLHGQAHTFTGLGLVYGPQGEYTQAAGHLQRALALYTALGETHGQAQILINLGNVQNGWGDHQQAADHYRRALALYNELDDVHGQGTALTNLGHVRQRQGDYDQAVHHHTRALELFADLGDPHGQGIALTNLGLVCQRRCEYEQAAEYHRRALEWFTEVGDQDGIVQVHNYMGELLAATTSGEQSYVRFQQALKLARAIGAAREEARALEGIGRCHLREAPPGDAAAVLRQALTIYRRLGTPDAQRIENALRDRPRTPAT
ncbi:ATP-binding protein [Spongiactinospora sp. 9N601]|uniref:ATP-binding protein n=1 Tax=Spongiactinospora sp. 9N601 TaxID=3375149 RepID=UPI003790A2CE